MSGPSIREIAQGRRRLQQLLPAARVVAARNEGDFSMGALGESLLPYLIESNFDALVVYPAPLGGFHADLMLKHTPHGVAKAMGSPVATPLRTLEEAEQFARKLLVFALHVVYKAQMRGPQRSLQFLLYDVVIGLESDLYKEVLDVFPEASNGYGSQEQAAARIERFMTEHGMITVTMGDLDQMDHNTKSTLWTIIHVAALSGLLAYPMRRDASPSGHSEAEQSTVRH
jgi:hypothetical protein